MKSDNPSYSYDNNNFDFIDQMIYVGSCTGAFDLVTALDGGNEGKLKSPTNPVPSGGWAVLNVAWDLDVEYEFSSGPCGRSQTAQLIKVGLVDGTGNLPSSMAAAVLMIHQLARTREYLCPKDQDTYPAIDNILVHCHDGDSRSVTVAALYLTIVDPDKYSSLQTTITMILGRRKLKQARQTEYLIVLAESDETLGLIQTGMNTQYIKPAGPCTLA